MDHLDQLSSSLDGHQDLPKGVLRSAIQANDNGSLHFLTSTGVGHSTREQEYIESTLLGTDLLSSQLPTNLLNDYINSVTSVSGPNAIGNLQSALLEHHYRPFGSDELHTLTNEPNNDTTIIVNGAKDIPGFSTLTSYEKIIDVAQSSSSMGNGLGQIAGTIESYVHFPLPGHLHTSEAGSDAFDMGGGGAGLITTHSHGHHNHHHHHHHHQIHQHQAGAPQQELAPNHYGLPQVSHHHHGQEHLVHHQSIAEQLAVGSQQVSTIQQHHSLTLEQPSAASSGMAAPPVEPTAMKVYSHPNGSLLPVASTVLKPTNVRSLPTMTFAPLRPPNESPKSRYYPCTSLPSVLMAHGQRATVDSMVTIGKHVPSNGGMVACESRTAEEAIVDCVSSMENGSNGPPVSCAQPGSAINLPHKKRLTKKLGDTKDPGGGGANEVEQPMQIMLNEQQQQQQDQPRHRDTVITNESLTNAPSIALDPLDTLVANKCSPKTGKTPPTGSFSCQLCGFTLDDQLLFFNHLKVHYEPAGSVSDAGDQVPGKAPANLTTTDSTKDCPDGKKPKPKLPRVKHTKKLKHERTFRYTEVDQAALPETVANGAPAGGGDANTNTASNTTNGGEMQLHELDACENGGGEFSETEDMLEGIRNVVQKAQEMVEKESTNDELPLTGEGGGRWLPDGDGSSILDVDSKTINAPVKRLETFGGSTLDTQDTLHGQSGEDNFVMFLSKTPFTDGDMSHEPRFLLASSDSSLVGAPNVTVCAQLPYGHAISDGTVVDQYSSLLPTEPQLPQPLAPMGDGSIASDTDAPFPPLHTNVIRTVDGTHSLCAGDDGLAIPSLLELSSSRMCKLPDIPSLATAGPCEPLSDLRKAKLLKDEHKSDDDDAAGDEDEYEDEDDDDGDVDGDDGDDDVHGADDAPDGKEGIVFEFSHDNVPSGVKSLHPLIVRGDGRSVEDLPTLDRLHHLPEDRKRPTNGTDNSSDPPDGGLSSEDGKQSDVKAKSKSQKFLCLMEDCGRRFNSKAAFGYHRLQHTGERPHKCATCEKRFFTCSALKVHERLHSGEKPYKCDLCGHHFRQWGDLKYHQTSIHSNEKSHKCEFCGKEFARRYSLVLHRRIHTNEKNYVCDYCNKGFRASAYLQSHRKIHTGEKPHQCTICDKKFRCHGDMKRHLKIHNRPDGKGKASPPKATAKGDAIDLTKLKPKRERIAHDKTVEVHDHMEND